MVAVLELVQFPRQFDKIFSMLKLKRGVRTVQIMITYLKVFLGFSDPRICKTAVDFPNK
jgi:hypothetical protein